MKHNEKIYEIFPSVEYPQLYSKRGFEKSRLKFIIPIDRTHLAYVTDKENVRLPVEL
jgi:hypothetical protein